MWRTPLLVVSESIIQLTMSFLLLTLKPSELLDLELTNGFSRYFQMVFGYFCIVLVVLLLVVQLKIVKSEEYFLSRNHIIQKYGSIYEDIKIKQKS